MPGLKLLKNFSTFLLLRFVNRFVRDELLWINVPVAIFFSLLGLLFYCYHSCILTPLKKAMNALVTLSTYHACKKGFRAFLV